MANQLQKCMSDLVGFQEWLTRRFAASNKLIPPETRASPRWTQSWQMSPTRSLESGPGQLHWRLSAFCVQIRGAIWTATSNGPINGALQPGITGVERFNLDVYCRYVCLLTSLVKQCDPQQIAGRSGRSSSTRRMWPRVSANVLSTGLLLCARLLACPVVFVLALPSPLEIVASHSSISFMAVVATTRVSVDATAPSNSVVMMLSSPTATSTAASPTLSTKSNTGKSPYPGRAVGVWSSNEHDRFLEALKKYPQGPWKAITEYIGTRSVRQVQTHAQKYQEKVSRRLHGMQTGKAIRLRREHRIDHEVLALHTLISLPPELRNKQMRRSPHHEVKHIPVAAPPAVVTPPMEPAAGKATPEFQRPTLTPVELDDNFCPIMDSDGASPSSVTSSFLFDDSVFALMDVDDLPTLSESLDFFIENLS